MKRKAILALAATAMAAAPLALATPAMAQSADAYEWCDTYGYLYDSYQACLDAYADFGLDPNPDPPQSDPPDPGTGSVDPMDPLINPCLGRIDCG